MVLLRAFGDKSDLSTSLAKFVDQRYQAAIERNDRFTVALSGGSLPKIMAEGLLKLEGIDYSKWHVFFADERAVPLEDDDSNFKQVDEAFFSKLPAPGIPREQIHTIDTSFLSRLEDEDALQELADEYEKQLVGVFARADTVRFPGFDLLLLGCGEDGHTCSLFPKHPVLNEMSAWVAGVQDSPKPPPRRITLTLPVIQHASHVAFVATGAGKKDILYDIFGDSEGKIPCAYINNMTGPEILWFVDDAAAERLESHHISKFEI